MSKEKKLIVETLWAICQQRACGQIGPHLTVQDL